MYCGATCANNLVKTLITMFHCGVAWHIWGTLFSLTALAKLMPPSALQLGGQRENKGYQAPLYVSHMERKELKGF